MWKIYIYSPTLHQDLYRKLIKSFSNFIPIKITQNILNGEDLKSIIEEIVIHKNFEKSETEIETYESIELKYPEEYDSHHSTVIKLDDLNDKDGWSSSSSNV